MVDTKLRKTGMKHIGGAVRNYIILAIAYIGLVLLLPANPADLDHYLLSTNQYRALRFLLAIPLVLVWFGAFYSYAKLELYAKAISKTREARGYGQLAVGCRWLAWGLSIPAMIALILRSFSYTHSGWHATSVIIINYLSLIFTIVAFSLIGGATRELATKAKRTFTLKTTRSLQLIFVSGGVLYCYLTFRHLDLDSLTSTSNSFYLPVWLLVISIIVPYLYAWFIGLLAAFDIALIARQAHGLLYRHALRLLASGLVVVIAGLISVQYLHTITPRAGHLSLNSTLILTYIIYMCMVLGFGLIIAGTNRLKRIEEV